MAKNNYYQFYVEGEDDKKVIETLKKDLKCIESGKIEVFNVIQREINSPRLRTLKPGTNVVLVYDTDVDNTSVLEKNVAFLKSYSRIKRVICIPQVDNLEDELVRATSVKKAIELVGSKTTKDYKRDLLKCTNLGQKLLESNFNMSIFWNQIPNNRFQIFGNDSDLIRKIRK